MTGLLAACAPPALVVPRSRPADASPGDPCQKTFTLVGRQSGRATDASMHTLRHAYATHLFERGVSWRVIQARLGPKRPSPTARSTHLTLNTCGVVQATSNALMADLSPLWGTGLPEVADVCRDDGPADQERFGADRLPSHRRAMDALIHCRTEVLGGQLWPCDHGGQEPYADHSCRHRSGPTCHQHDPEVWLAERRQARLPGPSLPVVLPRPQALPELVRRHHKDLDDMWPRAAAQALITRAMDPPAVGGLLGVLCILHTWTRTLTSHPPVHGLVPAGGVSADRTAWRPARTSSLVPVQARATRFRGLFLDLVRPERPDRILPEVVWPQGWVVYGKPAVPDMENVLNDLGRYLHRIALTHPRLLSIAKGQGCFRYQDAQDQRWKTLTWPAHECIRRLLPHVWPQGVHNVRYDGLWSPSNRPLRHHRPLCLAGHAAAPPPTAPEPTPPATAAWGPPLRAGQPCPACGQGLLVVMRSSPRLQRGPP